MTAAAGAAVSRTILVVDDEPVVRSVVCRLLQEWDFKVVEADNGRTVLQAAGELQGALSMVITDLAMPYMDGHEFAGAFRPLYPDVPILFYDRPVPQRAHGRLVKAGRAPAVQALRSR